MVPQPEQEARKGIDQLLASAGWLVCDADKANIHATRGVAIREFPLKSGHGFADYLYVDGKAAGVIEAKKEGATLTGVETQSAKYTQGLPEGLPRWGNPLPFSYQSTGVETRFTNGLDPAPRSRPVFAFHRPETLSDFLNVGWAPPTNAAAEAAATYNKPPLPAGEGRGEGGTFLACLQHMPALKTEGLWPAQIKAIHNLEQPLKENRPRALIQMATGDMIATGTDIKAVEVVMFMRAVKSRAFFEQMKCRGVRVIKPDDLQKDVMACCMKYQILGNRSVASKPPQLRSSSVSTY